MNHQKTKLLLYTSSLSDGGAERQFSYLLNHLDREKFDIILCLSKDKIEYECPDDIKKYILNKKHFWDFFRMLFQFGKIILQEEPDIVFTTNFNCNLLALVLKSALRKKFKLIIRETINPDWYRTQFPEIIYLPFLRVFYPLADLIISPSKGVRDALIKEIGRAEKQQFIHNMIDDKMVVKLSKEDIKSECFKENIPVLISVGRLDKQKGSEYLLYMLKKVNERKKSYLIIIGKGPLKDELKKLAGQLGLGDKVLFIGAVDNPFKYIARSTIFVYPSLFESFGNVLLEAMILGVPVVSTRAPYGPEEIIDEGENGFLVPTRDPDALADRVLTLLDTPELRHKFSKAGKKRVKKCFLIENQIKKIENIFLNILEQ